MRATPSFCSSHVARQARCNISLTDPATCYSTAHVNHLHRNPAWHIFAIIQNKRLRFAKPGSPCPRPALLDPTASREMPISTMPPMTGINAGPQFHHFLTRAAQTLTSPAILLRLPSVSVGSSGRAGIEKECRSKKLAPNIFDAFRGCWAGASGCVRCFWPCGPGWLREASRTLRLCCWELLPWGVRRCWVRASA